RVVMGRGQGRQVMERRGGSIRVAGCSRRMRGTGRAFAAWLAAFAVLAPQFAEPAVFQNLYTLTVSPEEGVTDRAQAVNLAMRQLLTRVTGDRDAGADPDL